MEIEDWIKEKKNKAKRKGRIDNIFLQRLISFVPGYFGGEIFSVKFWLFWNSSSKGMHIHVFKSSLNIC